MSDSSAAAQNVVSRQAFARILADPKVFGAAFLPAERAEWRGDRYTLGNAARRAPKGQFTGVRLQPADRRNVDQSRERAVQQDLVNLVRSLTQLRSLPGLGGTVLSREMLRGRDPSGVTRVRFGLRQPESGEFLDEAAAARECHDRIVRAIHGAGLRVAAAPGVDPSQGFAGLQAWANGVKLRQSKLASAAAWGRVGAIVGAVGLAAWMVPPIAKGITSQYAALREYLFPELTDVWGVAASDGDFTDKVVVGWQAVPKATGYAVYRNDMTTPIARIRGGETNHYEDLDAPIGEPLTYAVKPTTMLTSGSCGNEDKGFRNVPPPDGVKASDGTSTDFIELQWNPVEHATGYSVHRKDSGRQETEVCSVNETSCRDVQAPVGVDCQYTVRAITPAGASIPSSPDFGLRSPRKPEGLAASDGTDANGVDVRWNSVEGAEEYELERTSPDGTSSAPVRCRGTSHADTSAEPGRTYAYRVKAVCPRATSEASDADEGWRGFQKPVVKASDGDFTDRVHMTWTPVPGARGYEILRDGSSKPLAATDGNAATTYDDRSARQDCKHEYRVRPLTARNDTPASEPETGWRSLPPPKAVKASRGDTEKVVVEWRPEPDVGKYQVLRDNAVVHTTGDATECRFEDRGAEIGRLYGYSVATVSAQTGRGPPSDAVDGYRQLKPPQDVAAAAEGNRVVVTWKAVEGATGYEIFRSDQVKDPVGFARGHDAVSWADRQVPAGEFTYSVKARTETVTGPPSDATKSVSLAAPKPPDESPPKAEAGDSSPDVAPTQTGSQGT